MKRTPIKVLVLLAGMTLAFFAGRATSGGAAEASDANGERGEKRATNAKELSKPAPGPPRAKAELRRKPATATIAPTPAPTAPPNPPPPLHPSLLFSDFNVLTLEAIEALQLTVPEQLKVNELYRDFRVEMGSELSKHVRDVSDEPGAAPLGQYVIDPFPKEGAAVVEDFTTKISEALGSERGTQLSAAFRDGKRFADAGQNRVEIKVTNIDESQPPTSNSVGIHYGEINPAGLQLRAGSGPISMLREPYGLDLKVQ